MMKERPIKSVPDKEFHVLSAREQGHSEALCRLVDSLQHVNEVIQHAVEAGISIELVRVSRYHDTCGNWGDQMALAVRQPSSIK